MRAVKQKMVNSGHNPDDLDEFSYRRIRWLTDRPKDDGWTKIWEGDNSEYYKLLNLGVPVDAVRLRMEGDGYDPDTLDVGLFRKVQIRMKKEDFEYDEGKDPGIEYLKVRHSWFYVVVVVVVWLFGCVPRRGRHVLARYPNQHVLLMISFLTLPSPSPPTPPESVLGLFHFFDSISTCSTKGLR